MLPFSWVQSSMTTGENVSTLNTLDLDNECMLKAFCMLREGDGNKSFCIFLLQVPVNWVWSVLGAGQAAKFHTS